MTNDVPGNTLLRALIDSQPGIVIFALDREYRYVSFNEQHRQTIKAIWGKDISVGFRMLDLLAGHADHDKAKGQFDRALAGEAFIVIDDYGDEKLSRRSYQNAFAPMRAEDGSIFGLTCFLTDVTEQRKAAEELKETHARLEALIAEKSAALSKSQELEESLEKKNDELRGQVAENGELVERLRLAIDELSTPVLEVWDEVLALPVVGIVDSQRSVQMEERMLAAITQHKSRFVILDLTGVGTMDTSTADRFIKLARSSELLGAECIVTGIQPAVAQTLVTLGVEFATLTTARNLKQGLEICLSRRAKGLRTYDARRMKTPSI